MPDAATVDIRTERPRWGAFALVCLAYLGVTVGEQALAPVMPQVSDEIGINEGQTGLAFGLLAASIAAANLVAGAVLGRLGARTLMLCGLAATTAPFAAWRPLRVTVVTGCQSSDRPRSRVRVRVRPRPSGRMATWWWGLR